jgi:hypothetical protein
MKIGMLICCLLPAALFSQNPDSLMRCFFPEEKQTEWLRTYQGRLDDANDIVLVLAGTGGGSCKGVLQYLRSKESLRLEGEWSETGFRLAERDTLGSISGLWEGRPEGQLLRALWTNYDHSISKNALLREINTPDNATTTHCGDNKWIARYTSGGSYEAEMILQKGFGNEIRGMAYLPSGSYRVSGKIDDRNRLDLTLKRSGEAHPAQLTADFRKHDTFDASLVFADRLRQNVRLFQRDLFVLDCAEYADYVSSYDVSFPRTKHPAFNSWIASQADAWIAACRAEAKKGRAVQRTPELRASGRAFGWCDLERLDDDIITGFLTCQTSWSLEQQTIPINFDLKKGEPLGWKDVFRDEFKLDEFVKTIIRPSFTSHALYSTDAGFREWIGQVQFPYFTLRKDGVCFSTAFNTLYGRQSLTVPYADLKIWLRS